MRKLISIVLIIVFIFTGCRTEVGSGTVQINSSEDGLEIGTVITDDFSMDFFRFGHGDKTMVIIPGLSAVSIINYADSVRQSYSLLTDEFTIYAFDQIAEVPEGYSVEDMAHDLTAVINVLGLEDVYIFGASLGGMIAVYIASEHPDMVSKVILGSASVHLTEEQYQAAIGQWVDFARNGQKTELCLSFGQAMYPEEVFEQSRDALIATADTITDEDLTRFIIVAESIRDFNGEDQLAGITCPVLIIGSVDDKILGPEASPVLYDLLSGYTDCELYMYDGYGHAAYDLAPDYRARMLDFYLN